MVNEVLYFKSGIDLSWWIFALELLIFITFLLSFEVLNGSNSSFSDSL